MPHITLPDLPGILAPLTFRPETAAPLNALADALLRGPSPLSRGERELVAAFVSNRNACNFCERSHSAFAARQLEGGAEIVAAAKADLEAASLSQKMKALLVVAAQVQESGRAVTAEAIAAAREAGADDVEIHDVVLIAAAFCMFNRYVDGLGTFAPPEGPAYDEMAERVVSVGYGRGP
jgi:uncharacterized peroxidase-related enzyme